MIKNEKAVDGAANTNNGGSAIPSATNGENLRHHHTTSEKTAQGRIAAILPHGAENAVPARLLMQKVGLASNKQLRVLVDFERQRGALILSKTNDGGGYFLPDNGIKGTREIETFVKTFSAQAANTFRMLKPFRDAVKEWGEGE